MRKRSARNNFTSGVLDPLLANRTDIPQYRAGLRTGTNVMLLPHGGFMRRPGCRFCRELTGLGSTQGRTSRFRFNLEQSYLLHWRDERVDVYQPTSSGGLSDTDRITRIRTPYGDEHIPDLNFRAQTADTQVIFHQSIPPHRLLRAALRETNPIRTYVTSTTVRVYHPDHKLLDGDEIGLSGLEATGGIIPGRLNTFHEISVIGDSFGAADISATATDETLTLDLGADYGIEAGDRIKLSGLVATGGFTTAQLNRVHTVATVVGNTVTIEMPLPATATATSATGSWAMESFYEVDVGGSTTGITAADGGGTAGRSWVLHSLAPDDDREVCLGNIPQFDYLDGDSPQPKNEQQRLSFDDFSNGDSYKLSFSVPSNFGGGALVPLPFLDWASDDPAENGRRIEAEYAAQAGAISPVTLEVEYDTDESSGSHHEFVFRFTPAVNIDAVQVVNIRTAVPGGTATISPTPDVEGGSTEEDVISDTRGWPRGGVFYQGRLWMYGLASRPATILASKTNDLFNFDVGTATDSDAIDATGSFDPILDMIDERGLFALTSASEVEISGGQGPGITPANITLRVASRYGTSGVPAVSVAGRPIYIDRTGRTVRQLGFVEASGAAESKDISILSQFLVDTPVAMDVWRNTYGDYAAVCMEDGSLVVLNINVDQAVAGWTKWTTDGSFVDVCESGDILYVIVERTIGETDTYFLEAFDFNYHTDAGVVQAGAGVSTWPGLDHLEGETVQVRLGLDATATTMADAVVSSGDVVSKNGDVPITGTVCEAGLAIPTPTAEPMPGATSQFMAVTHVRVDMYESRAVFVDGYRLDEAELGASLTSIPLVTGWREMNLMGWGDRETVSLTFPEPQPATIRAVECEVAVAA